MPAEAPLLDSDLEIREALPDDAHAIAALYVWHVLNGRASFEEIPPTVDEMRKRIQTVRDNGLPWLVALWRGAIVGYCYATFYRPRPAYRYTLEESIYVESGMGGRGIGSALVQHVMDYARQQGLQVRPDCSFIHAWIERHPAYQPLSLAHGATPR